MRKKTIINIFHYATKYIIILFPLMLVLLSPFVKNESFIGSSEFNIEYKYQTNDVYNASDIVIGNAYSFNLDNFSDSDSSNAKLNLTIFDYDSYSNVSSLTFAPYTWNNDNNNIVAGGNNVWTANNHIYYSSSSNQYELDSSTNTWISKNWGSLNNFQGNKVWHFNGKTYLSDSSKQYVYNDSTNLWQSQSWLGYSTLNGNYIWTDGTNAYFSNNANQYKLVPNSNTWTAITWNVSFNGSNVWYYNDNIYLSSGSNNHYKLNLDTMTWETVNWGSFTSWIGANVIHIYDKTYLSNNGSYLYEFVNNEMVLVNTRGLAKTDLWFDGESYYLSNSYNQVKLLNENVLFNEIVANNGNITLSYYDLYNASMFNVKAVVNSIDGSLDNVSYISALSNDDNVILSVNYIDGGLFDDCCKFMKAFYDLPVNNAYKQTLNVLGLGSLDYNTVIGFVAYMPLWIFWVYMIDLVLDFLLFIPKIAHRWLSKGEQDD